MISSLSFAMTRSTVSARAEVGPERTRDRRSKSADAQDIKRLFSRSFEHRIQTDALGRPAYVGIFRRQIFAAHRFDQRVMILLWRALTALAWSPVVTLAATMPAAIWSLSAWTAISITSPAAASLATAAGAA